MMNNFDKIEKAIVFLTENFKEQPDLFEVSELAGVSRFHFQKMFKEWAGVSPKRFLQFISLAHTKKLLAKRKTVSEASYDAGFSSTSRLHDLFVSMEGMTPGEYKNGGKGLCIKWADYTSPFGNVIIASTGRGICYLAFTEPGDSGFNLLQEKFPAADFRNESDQMHDDALSLFCIDPGNCNKIKLHLKGTAFQLKVWEALLRIPPGSLTTYSEMANSIGSAGASRAVGSAVGANPVAFLIPCHRVIRSTGVIGEYHWRSIRKTAILGWESSAVYGE